MSQIRAGQMLFLLMSCAPLIPTPAHFESESQNAITTPKNARYWEYLFFLGTENAW